MKPGTTPADLHRNPDATFLVLFVFLLVSSGAWNGAPDWIQAVNAVAHLRVGSAAALSVVTVLVGLVLHPLQFALVQLYEGYWGTSDAARRAAFARAMRYWRRFWAASERSTPIDQAIIATASTDDKMANWLGGAKAAVITIETAFPEGADAFMPTRLGNVLRRYEQLAGAPFGVSIQVPRFPLLSYS